MIGGGSACGGEVGTADGVKVHDHRQIASSLDHHVRITRSRRASRAQYRCQRDGEGVEPCQADATVITRSQCNAPSGDSRRVTEKSPRTDVLAVPSARKATSIRYVSVVAEDGGTVEISNEVNSRIPRGRACETNGVTSRHHSVTESWRAGASNPSPSGPRSRRSNRPMSRPCSASVRNARRSAGGRAAPSTSARSASALDCPPSS